MELTASVFEFLIYLTLFLVPLFPAFALYKFAPNDRIVTTGTFSGMTINATGASAIYFVIFFFIYTKLDVIILNINTVSSLEKEIHRLKAEKPWTFQIDLTLMKDPNHEIDLNEYKDYVEKDSIIVIPHPMQISDNLKSIKFYIDKSASKQNSDTISSQLILKNGYGTHNIVITKKDEDTVNNLLN